MQIMAVVEACGLTIKYNSVRNEGRYSRVELTYPALFTNADTLRTHLLLEFTLSNVRLPTQQLGVNTIIEDVIKIDALFPQVMMSCISVEETAIEKWVGLTRRIIAIERNYHADDDTLIRHVYDLNSISQAEKIKGDFFALANTISELY
jgi:hypothetical protein